MSDNEDFLKHIGRSGDEPLDIAEAALRLGEPDREGATSAASVDRYRHHLKKLADGMAEIGSQATSATERAAALQQILSVREGYTGDRDDYDSMENADLKAVIDRRKGLPVALSILYLHAGRALGWSVYGLNFPGHFLIRVDGEGDRVIVDPFNDGKVVTTGELRALAKQLLGHDAELVPAFYKPISDRQMLVRLQNNIRLRALNQGDIPLAVKILYRLVLLDPERAEFWYELGMLEVHRERLRPGRDALEKCLMLIDHEPGNSALRQQILETLSELSGSIE